MSKEFLMELFFKQLLAFSEHINDSPDVVPTEKYAEYVLFSMEKRLKKQMDKKDIAYQKDSLFDEYMAF